MKKSELQSFIKEEILSILTKEASQEDINNQKELNKELEKTADLMSKMDMKEEEEGPTKADIKATKSLAKIKDELALLTKNMKSLARDYSKAEGEEKQKILAQLKDMTKQKKELESALDKA